MTSSTPATPGRHRGAAPRRRWRRWVFISAGSVVGVIALVVGAGFAYVEYRYHQIHRIHVAGLAPVTAVTPTTPTQHKTESPETILLIGDNCRSCLDGTQSAQYGTGAEVGGGRSDVTMLLRVYPDTSQVSILSIPRDLWLPIPDTDSEIRVDAALNSGPSMLVKTISADLDIPINHYMELNFDTFQDAVNAVGGINMAFPTRAYDSYSGLNVPAGCYHLNGTQALQVARARHYYYQVNGQWQYDGMGDISRIQRDHEFLRVLASTVSAKGLSNPITDNNLIGSLAKDLTIDDNLGIGGLLSLAKVFAHVNIAASPQVTLPVDINNTNYTYRDTSYGDVVFPANSVDRPIIDTFLGPAAPTHLAPSLPVTVVDGSGTGSAGTTTAAGLRALGYQVAGERSEPLYGSPAESVVYYAPGHEAQAESLAGELGGAVALGENATIAGTGLTVLVGTNLTVSHPATPASHPATATAGSTAPKATAPPAPPSSTLIGGLTESNPSYPSYDPTACPSGAKAQALPNLPVPQDLPST